MSISPLPPAKIGGENEGFGAVSAGDTVVFSSLQVRKPVAVRFGWANCPEVNLRNKDDLPASPLGKDGFRIITAPK